MDHQTAILPETWGWALLLGFAVLWVVLGRVWGQRAKSLDGFMLAGRNVGMALGAATAVATWVTSNTTMLAPQFALQLGVWGMLAYSTAAFGLFLFAPMAKRIRTVMPTGYTSAEFFRLRYGTAAYVAFLIISLFYSLTWLISMGMAGGVLLEALSGIDYRFGMSVVLAVCVLYTLFGGLYAVIGTDFIQSLIILIGVVAVGVAILMRQDFGDVYGAVVEERPALLDVLFPAALMAIFNNLLFGLGEIFHSNVWWSRAFAMREGVGQKAYFLGGLLWLPIPIAAGFIALAAPAMGINITSPDMVGPVVASHLLGAVGSILVFVVIFASIASSIDSLLAATSDVITNDIIKPLMKTPAEQSLRRASAFTIIGLGLFAWLVCLPRVGTLATVLFFAGPLVGSTIWPIIAGLYWKKTNRHGVTAALVLGSGSGLISYFTLGWYTAALVGTAVSMVTVLLSTLLWPEHFDWRRLRTDEERTSVKTDEGAVSEHGVVSA